VEPESGAEGVQRLAHGNLGLGILRPNQRHHLRALRFDEDVARGPLSSPC
jgi:hypothetical protein